MSISDDAQHHEDEHKALDDEYLDEFDEDRTLRKLSDTNGYSSGMKKQESIMEDDPELKHLEEQQNLKNQQIQQQLHDKEFQDLQMDAEMKGKKTVTISDEQPKIHEKPREARTAKQRWHWAYNRIVHQQQVSWAFWDIILVTLWRNDTVNDVKGN